MKKYLKSFTFLAFFILVFFTISFPVSAFTTRTGQSVTVSREEVINEILLITGSDIFIDGTVNSDIYCAGRRIEINGTVDGDVICAGQNITVNGKVNGNVRIAGQNVTLKGNIAKNVIVFGQSVTNEAIIEGEMLFGGQDTSIYGQINKNLMAFAQSANLNAPIGGKVDMTAESLYLGSKTAVKGDLTYTSNNKLTSAPEAIIYGKTIQKSPPKGKTDLRADLLPKKLAPIRMVQKESWLIGLIKSILISLVVGFILAFLFKDRLTKTVEYIALSGNRVSSMGKGLLLFFLTPAVILVLLVTIIGIPVAILLAIAYGIVLAVSRIITAIAVGRLLTAEYWKDQKNSIIAATFLGVVTCWVVFAIPWLGKVFSFIAMLWGMGGIYYFFRPARKASK